MVQEVGLGVLFVLAFANGANDVGKSVASLITSPSSSSSRLGYRPLLWGGLYSGLGSISAILISGRLFSVFTPQSLLRVVPGPSFVLAALLGATIWVLAATVLELPVSSTHAILGAVLLLAVYVFGVSNLEWDFLVFRVLLPLAAGPFVALVGTYLFERLTRGRLSLHQETPRRIRIIHWGSAAATSFARGINDAPKMAALGAFFLLGRADETILVHYLIVAVAVVMGSIVWGHRVALTLVRRAVPLDHGQRLRAGVATAALVSAGAYFGAPLSTTHVSAGATAGVGGVGGDVLRSVLQGMVLPWVVTLPAAGLLAILASLLGGKFWS